jgi:stress-induced morphogen
MATPLSETQMQQKVAERFPGAEIYVRDLTGTSDHWQVLVIAPQFAGKTMIEQHRMVKAIFENDIQSGAVHALSLKTYTPQEWSLKGGN